MQALCIVNVASVDDEQVLNANLPTNGRRIMIAMNLDYPKRPPNSPTHFEYYR